uniref:(California timema) hypothetical protein n=1 Tax=Timema californicum TaxID=61474 RepID=A0A7R9P4H4_TIMCA|nr:unnamed protein product [Timema californicum]
MDLRIDRMRVDLLAVSSGSASPTPPPHSSTSTLPATSSSTTAVTSSAPVARPGSPPTTPGAPPPRCCETGRPIYTDPLTGQTVCSCQYDLLSYQRLASAGVGAAGIPALSMYSAPYADGMAAYFPALGADQAPFYTATDYCIFGVFITVHPTEIRTSISPSSAVELQHDKRAAGLELKENLASGAAWPYPSVYHPYDAAFAGYPFNGCPDRNQKKKEVSCRHHLYGVSLLEEVLPTPPPYPLVRCHCPDDTLDLRRKLRHCISGDRACQSVCARILLPGLHALLSGVPLIIISVSFSPYFMSDLFSTLPPCSPEQMREYSPPPVYTHICCQIKRWCLSARVIGNERNTSIVKCSEFSSSDPEDLGSITGTSRFFCEAVGLERGQLNLMRSNDELLE